jgi:hypothetical protein
MKLELLTYATVVDDAIRFISESNELDYNEDEDQLKEEREEETAEI